MVEPTPSDRERQQQQQQQQPTPSEGSAPGASCQPALPENARRDQEEQQEAAGGARADEDGQQRAGLVESSSAATSGERQQQQGGMKKRPRFLAIRWLYLMATYIANATAVYYFYTQVFPNNEPIGLLAYGFEFMRAIPLFDLAQMNRLWAALPLGCLCLELAMMKFRVPKQLLLLAGLCYLCLHFYRNYQILFHMEHFSWPLLVLMSMRSTSWFVFFGLYLNASSYKIYPLYQYDASHLATRTWEVLDRFEQDPSDASEHGAWIASAALFLRWLASRVGVAVGANGGESERET